jgi:hypothetical protein
VRVDLGEERLALSSSFLGSLEMLSFGGGLGLERFDLGSSFGPVSWYLSFFLVAIFVWARRSFDFRCSGLLIAVPLCCVSPFILLWRKSICLQFAFRKISSAKKG